MQNFRVLHSIVSFFNKLKPRIRKYQIKRQIIEKQQEETVDSSKTMEYLWGYRWISTWGLRIIPIITY